MSAPVVPSENHYRKRVDVIADDLTGRYFRVVRPHADEVRAIAQDIVDAQIDAARDLDVLRAETREGLR